MSGGVDSTVAAILLKQAGYEVVGCTFRFFENNNKKDSPEKAAEIAERLKINHLTIDLKQEFNKIVTQYFINEYKMGKTPFPCAVCNHRVKFKNLILHANNNDFDYVSTGHYANTRKYKGSWYIHQALDKNKDQSFFLWGLKHSWISQILFPLGDINKENVKKIAAENGFAELAKKKESFGACFIEGNYREFLKANNVEPIPGNFIDNSGKVLGTHQGICSYTVGQRHGLGLNCNRRLYVSEIKAAENEVVLQKYSALYKKQIKIKDYYFIDREEIEPTKIYTAKVRYRKQETQCRIIILNKTTAQINLLDPETMIANGQTAVFYKNDRLLGGGFIFTSE